MGPCHEHRPVGALAQRNKLEEQAPQDRQRSLLSLIKHVEQQTLHHAAHRGLGTPNRHQHLDWCSPLGPDTQHLHAAAAAAAATCSRTRCGLMLSLASS